MKERAFLSVLPRLCLSRNYTKQSKAVWLVCIVFSFPFPVIRRIDNTEPTRLRPRLGKYPITRGIGGVCKCFNEIDDFNDAIIRNLQKGPDVPDPCRETKLDILCKVAIVTGGVSGIGYAAAYELLNHGAKLVVLAHPDQKKGKNAVKCLCDQFGMFKAQYLPCDIGCPKQFEDIFICTKNACQKVDILLNNAGVMDDKNWESSLNTNVVGTLRGMLLAYKYMKGNNSVVINICGTPGLSPWPNCPIFAASKHAIVTASRCFGNPFHYNRTNIRVIGLCPSFTNTPTWDRGILQHLDPEWGQETLNCLSRINMQSANLVGRAVAHLVKYGKSGKIYVCDKGVLHRAAFPREEDILQPEPLS